MSSIRRRLAAIMFTDLVGFTRLAQRNEEEALRLRKEHQAIVRPLFASHGGREVKTMGDGFLVEFPSAMESVGCAVDIQEALATRNTLASSKDPILLRVGIHVGEVVEEESDILGDAVNVASRIEPLAEPGGICVSATVFDQIRNKLSFPLEKLGARHLKNVDQPVELYRVVLGATAARPPSPAAETSPNLRLAVLPFANLSPDANDEFFADGLTDELISQVSKIPTLRVIAKTSVLRYKGSPKTIRDVKQDLGVRLALEGSVRKAGNRVRITVQLVDTNTEEQLWSGRYDRPFDDIFAIQDDIAGQISMSISGHLSALGITTLVPFARTPADTADLAAYSDFLHGRKLLTEKVSEATVRQSLVFFESAVRRDPQFARARVGIAEAMSWLAAEGVTPITESDQRARVELETALERNEALAEAHSVLAGLCVGSDETEKAEREARRAIALNPSLSDPYRWLAQIEAGDGKMGETVRLLEAAQRIDPVDVNIIAFLGRAYSYAGRDADALEHWQRTKSIAPFRTNAHLTEFYLGRGEIAKAEETFREMERLRPDSVWVEMYRGVLAARRGETEKARRALARLERRRASGTASIIQIGFLHFAMGEMDGFAECMERAFTIHSLPLLELMYSPLYDGARSDPRILDLLRRQHALRARGGSEVSGPSVPSPGPGG